MVSTHTTLYLRVSEAKELLAKDFNGKSDPYCVIKVDNVVIARTATVYKTLDPLWGEEFILHMPSGFQILSFYIYDADKVSSGDDIIGVASVTRDYMYENKNPKGLETWLPLQKANKDLEIQGEMLLEYGIRTSEATGQSYVFVTVMEGRDLAAKDKTGYSDPYVTVTCFDETKATSKQKKTRFPEWNETLEFLLPEDTCIADLSVIVTVWDKDNFSSDDFMGQIHLDSEDVTHGTIRNWHAVARRPTSDRWARRASRVDRGKIRVKLQLLEEIVLPSSCYRPLNELLAEAVKSQDLGHLIWDMIEQDRTIELGAIAMALVRFYLSQELIFEFLDAVIVRDIAKTEDVNTLFRGNTLGTKAVDNFMKVLAMPYLQKVLKPTVDRIINEKKTVELDPCKVNSVRGRRHSLHRESEESFVNHSLEALEDYTCEIINSIVGSITYCPQVLRRVLKNIQVRVREKWPEEMFEDVPYIAVSSFIFLRFFAPAVMSPKLFSVSDQHPNLKVIRTFTLLAKIVQSIGNLIPGSLGKEVWMEPLLPLISQKITEVKDYLDLLVDVGEFSAAHRYLVRQQSNETVLIQGHLYKCHYHCKRLFRPIVLKKCYFYLTRVMLCYRKTPEDEDTMVMVENICAVEKLDYGALGKSNMGQIIHKTSDESTAIIYFQAKDVNELTAWISAIRKTCKYNVCRVETFHPGVFKGDKWNCCRREQDIAPGCSPTYHGVVLGDWQDPLDPDVDAQIIYSQIAHSKDKIRKMQHDLRMSLAGNDPSKCTNHRDVNDAAMASLSLVSGLLDVTEQLAMSHQTFVESSPRLSHSLRSRSVSSSVSGDDSLY
ncbi:rasGAP-activating-like protein 1 isoform X3 [Biomphalaria glabrata]|uniref:RasGAP-activating-like protein 1 isoform X3 n=1 Tax=Biomphalaria glabrata TaxID=6526 RepID=A0A2C9LEA0_BIOGL|nr:rasGAP-activating-like protein 1 isoform X3 [Biomphalaria glabrata]